MAQATQTVLGEIRLAGDLGGNNNALAPALTSTGVTAGSYTIPVITVDAKGRITTASNASGAQVAALMPDATTSTKGIVVVPSGAGLAISGGTLSAVNATESVKGIASFGAGFAVSNGNVVLSPSAATDTVFGAVRTGGVGTNITNTGGTLSAPLATNATVGVASFSTGLVVNAGVVTVDTAAVAANVPVATTTNTGVVRTGTAATTNIAVDGSGTISVPVATNSVKGVASFSTGTSVTGGVVTVDTAAVAANLPLATTTTAGVVRTGTASSTNIVVDGSGTISVPVATNSIKGVVSTGTAATTHINIGPDGVISVPAATNSVKGVASFSTGLVVNAGVVTVDTAAVAANLPVATTTTLGVVKSSLSSNIYINPQGGMSVDAATALKAGAVRPLVSDFTMSGSTLTLSANVARRDAENTWSGVQNYNSTTIPNTVNTTPNFGLTNVLVLQFGLNNVNIENPTNIRVGATYHIFVKQHASVARAVTWGTSFKFATGAPTTFPVAGGTYYVTIYAAAADGLMTTIHGPFGAFFYEAPFE